MVLPRTCTPPEPTECRIYFVAYGFGKEEWWHGVGWDWCSHVCYKSCSCSLWKEFGFLTSNTVLNFFNKILERWRFCSIKIKGKTKVFCCGAWFLKVQELTKICCGLTNGILAEDNTGFAVVYFLPWPSLVGGKAFEDDGSIWGICLWENEEVISKLKMGNLWADGWKFDAMQITKRFGFLEKPGKNISSNYEQKGGKWVTLSQASRRFKMAKGTAV